MRYIDNKAQIDAGVVARRLLAVHLKEKKLERERLLEDVISEAM
jgi:hypothetical protein